MDARLVHWQTAPTTGRPVQLDDQNRVKALVCVGALREALDLSQAYIIHPDVGVAMLRARGYRYGDRPPVPDNICRLQSMCSRALECQQVEDEADEAHYPLISDSDCLLCTFRVQNAPFADSLGKGKAIQCSICLSCLFFVQLGFSLRQTNVLLSLQLTIRL